MNRLLQFQFISSWFSALLLLFIAFHHEEYAVAFLHHPIQIKCRSRTRIRDNHNGNHGQTRSRCMESPNSNSDNDVVTKFDIGICNIPGVDWQRPNKVNQDSNFVDAFTFQLADNDNGDNDGHSHEYTVVGVLDGHGKHGQDISTFAAQHMPREVYNQLLALATSTSTAIESLPKEVVEYETKSITKLAGFDCSQFKSSSSSCCANNTQTQRQQQQQVALINAFHLVHYNAMCDESVRSGRNGATCITCLIDHNTNECTVAYVGDSRAILIHSNNDNDVDDNDSNNPTSSNNWNTTISVIAREQTVDLPEERRRIESREGSIRGKNVFYGPVGIAMTRSLGNAVMIRAGVIPTPMVDTIQLLYPNNVEEEESNPTITPPTATLILATDGVWDVLSNEEVKDICSRHLLAQDAADAIAKTARERWVGDLPIMDEVKADDITIMVVKL